MFFYSDVAELKRCCPLCISMALTLGMHTDGIFILYLSIIHHGAYKEKSVHS